jgi:hypothetical protein
MDYAFTLCFRHPPWKFYHAIDTIPAEHTAGDCQRVFYCVGTGAYGCLPGELAYHISVEKYKLIKVCHGTVPPRHQMGHTFI